MSGKPKFEWVDVGGGKRRLIEIREEEPPSPNRSRKFAAPNFTVKAGVGHVARSLPHHLDENGEPVIKGAAGYTNEYGGKVRRPIIESQADIDRIRKMNPEMGLTYGNDTLDATLDAAGIDDIE